MTLLGLILLMTGLRTAFGDSRRPQSLMDFAVAAMAVGVTLEIATIAMAAGTSWLTAHGGTLDQVRTIDSAAVLFWVWMLWRGVLVWRGDCRAATP